MVHNGKYVCVEAGVVALGRGAAEVLFLTNYIKTLMKYVSLDFKCTYLSLKFPNATYNCLDSCQLIMLIPSGAKILHGAFVG